jgi:flagellar basal body-associated protein FliL
MRRSLAVALLALVGLLCAAGMGYAAYVVSRGSVSVPVTRLQQTPAQQLTPARVRAKPPATIRTTPTTTRTVAPPAPITTVDDHGGGGHGGDD